MLLTEFVCDDLLGRGAGHFLKLDGLEPAFRLYHFAVDLSYACSVVIQAYRQRGPDLTVTLFVVDFCFWPMLIRVETVL